MTRFTARACAFVFLAVICVPPLLGVVGMRTAAIENRSLSEFPLVRPTSAVDQDFYTALSAFLNDHLPLRDRLVRLNSLIALNVWRESPNPQVYVGANGWLYATPFRLVCPDKMPLEVVDRIGALGRALAASGRQMRMVLAPSKSAIYPEYLGAFPPPHFACGHDRLQLLRTGLSEIPEVGFIDMAPHLRRLKETAVEPLYFPQDSHWTLRSAAAMSRAVVESIQPGLWRDADVEDVDRVVVPMDLALLIGVPQSVTISTNRSHRQAITTSVIERADCEQGPSCIIGYASSGAPAQLIQQRTLFIRDSFGTMSIETLAPYFADITFLFWSDDILKQLADRIGDADLVIYETLDQFVFSRVESGFTAQAIPASR